MSDERKTIVYVASTASLLASFWRPLMRRMAADGWRVVACTPPGPRWADLAEPGIEHERLDIARRIGAVGSHLRSLADLYAMYRRLQPAMVHHLTSNPVIFGSLAARAAAVPHVVNTLPGLGAVFTSQHWDAPFLRAWTLAALRLALRLGRSRTVFQNRADRAALVERGVVPADRAVLILGSGVDLERFRPQPEPGGDPTVLFCARMLWSKGVGDLVAAARILRQRGARFRLQLVGPADTAHHDGVPAAQLAHWAAEGIADWLGRREDMPEMYAASNLVVLPTRYGEGIPSVLIEAAASGRAIVASDAPGCREVVRHGRDGLLVPTGDSAALAAAIERLLADRTLRATMGRSGRERVVAEFGENKIVDEMLQLYATLRGASDERRAA